MRYLFRIIALILVLVMVPVDTQAQKRQRAKTKSKTTNVTKTPNTGVKTSAEAKKKQAETQKEIKQTEAQIRENESNVKKSLSELGKLDQEITKTNARIKELNAKLQSLNGEITTIEKGIESNEADLVKLRAEYLKAVKKMRVTKKNKSTLAFIFSSKSVNQAMRRMRYLKEFSAWRGRQTEEITQKTTELKAQKDALAKAQEEQKNALALQQADKTKLAKQHAQQEGIVADLKKNGEALQSHLKKKQAEASELGNLVSQLIAEEQRKAAEEEAKRKAAEEEAKRKAAEEARRNEELLAQQTVEKQESSQKDKRKSEKTKEQKAEKANKPTEYADARKRKPRSEKKAEVPTQSTTDIRDAGSFEKMKGKLPYPTTGSFSITSRFGRQHLPDLPDVEYDNPGIDAETDAGASAMAVYKGKVSGVYLLPGYNTVVIVNHGNYYTVYGNISSPNVKNGDAVDTGSSLGKLALNDEDTNHSSIHFEVWRNREKQNPQDWLR